MSAPISSAQIVMTIMKNPTTTCGSRACWAVHVSGVRQRGPEHAWRRAQEGLPCGFASQQMRFGHGSGPGMVGRWGGRGEEASVRAARSSTRTTTKRESACEKAEAEAGAGLTELVWSGTSDMSGMAALPGAPAASFSLLSLHIGSSTRTAAGCQEHTDAVTNADIPSPVILEHLLKEEGVQQNDRTGIQLATAARRPDDAARWDTVTRHTAAGQCKGTHGNLVVLLATALGR